MAEYLEKFGSLVHQILAHDPKFSAATITNPFTDGLKDDIKAVVLVQRPGNLDTASSIVLLQEETTKDAPTPKREYKKNEANSSFGYSRRGSFLSFSNHNSKNTEGATAHTKKGT